MAEKDIPLYPRPFRQGAKRTLAYFNRDYIITEHGQIMEVESMRELLALMQAENLLVYTEHLNSDMVLAAFDAGAIPMWSPSRGDVIGLLSRTKRRHHYLYRYDAWPGISGPSMLRHLRKLFVICGVGDYPTPSTLAQALMRRFFNFNAPRLRRPPWPAWRDMYANLIGGRSELYRPGSYAHAFEEDINSAYPTSIASVPGGDCRRLVVDPRNKASGKSAWYYAEYEWMLASKPAMPLLGVRDTHGGIWYPSTPRRRYRGWYTKEEVEAAERMGYQLSFIKGWGFSKLIDVFAEWSNYMQALRDRTDGVVRDWVKLMSVAGIGKFGRENKQYTVLPPTFDGDHLALDYEGNPLYCVVESEDFEREDYLIQIALKVHSDVRLVTYFRALPYKLRKELIAVNFDAIYYVPRSPSAIDAEGKDKADAQEDIDSPIQFALPSVLDQNTWRWKQREHTNARFPKRRWILSDQAVKTPGIPH